MKYAKSAAVFAGSVIALGAAAPAFAVNPAGPKASVNGALSEALRSEQLDGHQFRPLVDTVNGAAGVVRSKRDELVGNAKGVAEKVPLLGGQPAGKLNGKLNGKSVGKPIGKLNGNPGAGSVKR